METEKSAKRAVLLHSFNQIKQRMIWNYPRRKSCPLSSWRRHGSPSRTNRVPTRTVRQRREEVSGYFPSKKKTWERKKANTNGDEAKAATHNNSPHQKQPHIDPRQQHLHPRLPIPAPIQKQPKDPTEPIREPARKQRRDETEQIIEDGNRFRHDPRDGPEDDDDERPDAEAGPGALAHAVGAAVAADVDKFSGDVAVDDAWFLFSALEGCFL